MTVLPVVTGFLYRLRTQTIIRQKVYSTEEGSVVGNDDMPMDDDIDEQEDYSIMKCFHFSVFQDMCCMILCSNGVHTFFLQFSFTVFCCTQGFGNFLALHVSFCNITNNYNSVAIEIDYATVLQLRSTEMTNAFSVFLYFT